MRVLALELVQLDNLGVPPDGVAPVFRLVGRVKAESFLRVRAGW